jgi:hypothetical protein
MDAATHVSSRSSPSKQMFGANVLVFEPVGLFGRKLQHALRR